MRLVLTSPEDTMELGAMLARAMSASTVRNLYLFADLGGGKTTLARGFVAALPGGETAEVASPSFTHAAGSAPRRSVPPFGRRLPAGGNGRNAG